MAQRTRSLVLGSAALAIFLSTALAPSAAHARHRWGGRDRGGWSVGAAIAGAVVGAAIGAQIVAPAVSVEVHAGTVYYPPPPPPPVYYAPPPPPPVYYAPPPPPPVYYAPPQPRPVVVVAPAPAPESRAEVGIAASAVMHAPTTGQMPVGGVAIDLQLRSSSHTMLALELQSLGARNVNSGERRTQLDGLAAGRLFLWDASLAPYFEIAGGIGRTSVEESGFEYSASQLVGRAGFGVELRIGRHMVFEGSLARTARWRLDRDRPEQGSLAHLEPPGSVVVSIDDHESATEARAGLAFRF